MGAQAHRIQITRVPGEQVYVFIFQVRRKLVAMGSFAKELLNIFSGYLETAEAPFSP